jgi:hypothetical protein
MPIARFQMPDGRIARFEVPEGTTPEQAQTMIQQQIGQMGQTEFFDVQTPSGQNVQMDVTIPKEQTALEAEAVEQPQSRGFMGTLRDIGSGISEAVTGRERETELTQTLPEWTQMPELNSASFRSALTGLGTLLANPDEVAKVVQSNFPDTQVFQDEKGNYVFRSSIDQQDYIIKPGFRVSDIPRVIGGLAAFTPAGRAQSVIGAGLAGAGTQAAIEATQAATGGTFDPSEVALAGATGAAFPAAQRTFQIGRTALQRPPLPPEVGTAQREGIRLMTSDVLPPETFTGKIAQTAGERIPFAGTSGMRLTQQQERITAVRRLLDDFGAGDFAKLSDDVMADLSAVKRAERAKYTGQKSKVINRLSTKGNVPVPRALKAIDDEIVNLTNRRSADADQAAEVLKRIRNELPNRDLAQLEAYRADELAKAFMGDSQPASVAALEIGEKALRKIYDPVRQDMADFIRQNGERRDVNKWMVANKQLADSAGDMKNAALKRVLTKGDVTPEVVQNLLFSGKPSEVRALYARLSPTGKANARAAILSKAATDAIQPGGLEQVVSPTVFANNVKKMGNSVGVVFSGDDLKRVEGLVRVLDMTRRAGDAAAAPPTGVQATPFLMGSLLTDVFGGTGGMATLKAGATAGTIGSVARVYESAPVRNLLLKMSATKPGSQTEMEVFRQLQALTQTQRQLADE